jgi:DMSO/TMAO reductase YedYZ heme-binding membrane subunit
VGFAVQRGFGGPRLVAAAAVAVAALCGALLSTPSPGAEELRATIRLTALTSVVFFGAAFTASALARLHPSQATRWLLTNRRYLGLSFAVSHLAHGLAIAALQRRTNFLADYDLTPLIGGGLAFVLIALLAATSNDAAVRWLGAAMWKRLHTIAVYYLWFTFIFTYMGPALSSPYHAALTLLLALALALRIAARRA